MPGNRDQVSADGPDVSRGSEERNIVSGPGRPRVDCAIVVVTHNNVGDLPRLVTSLPSAVENLQVRIVVVDNSSSDGTPGVARSLPGVECFESGGNLGYAAAINIARIKARPFSSLLVANPDTWFEAGSIARLFQAVREPGVGIAVPTMVDDDGAIFRSLRREPTIGRALGEALIGSRFSRRPGWLAEVVYDTHEYRYQHSVDWATGAVLVISEACDAAVGCWDEARFFLYSEETDYCRRVRQAGYRINFIPTARAWHRGAGSGTSDALLALLAVNRIRYYEKWHGRPASSLFRAAVTLNELLRSASPPHRGALRYVARRSTWRHLPGPQR